MVNPTLWSCRFVHHPRQLPLDRPFVLLADSRVDAGAARLLAACAGDVFAGEVSAPDRTPEGHRLVVSSRDWPQLAQAALPALAPDRIVILLHLDYDPHGYWDFALGGDDDGPGLGGSLGRILAEGIRDPDSFAAAAAHADYWMASRTRRGRMSAGAHHIMAHYPDVTARHAGSLVRILSRLADQKSRDALTRILFGTAEQILDSYAAEVFGPQQYMDIIRIRAGDTIINGGVETGWELPYFITAMGGEGRIHSFDPIFQIEGRWPEPAWRTFSAMLTDHEVALVEADRPLRMAVEPGFGTAYGSGADPEAMAQAGPGYHDFVGRALDTMVAEGSVGPFTVVKLDVEGGELAALRGMATSLRRFRPRLAVAIYHEPDHFFEIPTYLMDLLEDYRFYVRHYSCGRFETLLYAVPAEDSFSRSGEEFGPVTARVPAVVAGPPVLVTAYRQDGTPRRTHRAEVSQLDRVKGGDWAFADIRPVARAEGLRVLSVTETAPGSGTIVAQAPGSAWRDAVFVGDLVDPLAIAWKASREVAAGAAVPVVGLTADVAVVAEYVAAEDALYVYRLGDGVTDGVAIIRPLGMAPVALHAGEAEGRIRLLGRAGEVWRLVETTLAPGAPLVEIAAMAAGNAAFRAVCLVTDHHTSPARQTPGYLFAGDEPDEQTVLVPASDGGFREARRLDWPDEAAVSTGVLRAAR
jgi:FkbM family methyltransferase